MKSKVEEIENQNEQINYGGLVFTGVCLYLSSVISVISAIVVGDRYFDKDEKTQDQLDSLNFILKLILPGMVTILLAMIYYKCIIEDSSALTSSKNFFSGVEDNQLDLAGQIEAIIDSPAE